MYWSKPGFDRTTINAAARQLLATPTPDEYSREIVDNWRNSHFFPLNTFKVTLRTKAKSVFTRAVVSERRKRLKSILAKLRKEPLMRFTQMQDLAGCRAVMSSVKTVYELVAVYRRSDLRHQLKGVVDYIAHPRVSGYRGIHLIYSYVSDKNDAYNGLKVEIQIRSPLQHAWATAVETVGTFLGQALKSSQGEDEWLRFFALMGTYMAICEKTAPVPGTPTHVPTLRDEIRHHAEQLKVIWHLQAYAMGLVSMDERTLPPAAYYLLDLDVEQRTLHVQDYKTKELAQATADANELERNEGSDVVLVAVSDLKSLRRAYPNYFADTTEFLARVSEASGLPVTMGPHPPLPEPKIL